jgi:inositol phosphorylceramide mannosyltransferase catalytic subunit
MSATASIPRTIIQTGRSRALPLIEQAAAANLKNLNPDFRFIFFDDAEVDVFIDSKFPQYRSVFYGFPHRIQRFDFFRYLAVYELGGFYFDLDVFLARGIGDLTNAGCVFPFEELTLSRYLRQRHHMDWEIGNYAFGASAGHPFLRAVIDNCVRCQTDPTWAAPMMEGIPLMLRAGFDVLNTTGPGVVTRTLAENPEIARTVSILFPDDVCDERTWHNFGTYGVHLMAASWRKPANFLMRRLARLWENRTRSRQLAESRKYGPKRRRLEETVLQPLLQA